MFIDQAYRLLRAACVYCKGFRLSAKDLHLYICKLKLIQHGFLQEAHIVGSIGDSTLNDEVEDIEDSEAEEEHNSMDVVIRKREKYVKSCLSSHKLSRADAKKDKHEGPSAMRQEVIKEFLVDITRKRECASCHGISPTYRKERCVKIFEKPLSDKEKAKMAQRNFKRQDAMARVHTSSQKQNKLEPTEEIQAEVEEQSSADEMDIDQDESVLNTTAEFTSTQRYISAMEVRARLAELFKKEQDLLSLLYDAKPATKKTPKVTPDMFFATLVLVPPNKYRPEARMGESQVSEAEQNSLYKAMLRGCNKIAQLHKALVAGNADITQLHIACTELQEFYNSLIDRNHNPVQGAAAKRNEEGIKQKLEKKEGLFRKNMMGKRVNYAARSVISPDPYIETNEIGVPPVFATKLTYPEPVTSHNFRDMQQAVINGVDKWPGAAAIEDENGQVVSLRKKSVEERVSLANQLLAPTNSKASKMANKKVHRHLTNGDVVLMNRQPTLHKPSIMGHRVRVLPAERTLRMHYANCNTYNADFDGDEMNMHFPQNEVARAEALQIADTDHQYLSGTQGKPLRGLIQDHLSVSVALCNRDTLFTRSDYHQLVYSALRPESGHILGERLQLIPPAIIKPVPRWTGKQVITTILKNIQPYNCGGLTMKGETQLKAEQWGRNSEEGTVLFQDGEFITGILDKSQIGQSSGGMIHAIHEVYGAAIAGKLLSCLGRLLTRYLNMRAFSCGMDDLRLTPEGEKARIQELRATETMGLQIASNYVSLKDNMDPSNPLLLERLEEALRDDKKQEGLDLLMNAGTKDITSEVQSACIPHGLEKPFPRNQMQTMTTSGAKGSRVNASLISCNLGQQVLESRRVPIMVSGKSLPCFKPFETNIKANGYIASRFLTGIKPQEYFFHHMAGREGLIDTAVKTSRSGYLQRCVIKGLEGLAVTYDTTVRDADGSIIQFVYGEDGLDVTKQKYLTDFNFILRNVASEASQLQFEPAMVERVSQNREVFTKYMKSAVKHAGDKNGKDPLMSHYNPTANAFVTSESFYEAMTNYIKDNKEGLIRGKSSKQDGQQGAMLNKKNAEMLFAMKYLRSLVEPGEAVGVVAGQSIGEPSTQMTLNTFHLAGHSARNVTQGIPRLREILMTATRDVATPAMTLQPLKTVSSDEVENFTKKLSALPFSHVLDSVSVQERVGRGKIYGSAKTYNISFKFFPSKEYSPMYAVEVSDIMDTVEKKVLRKILSLTKAEIKKKTQATKAVPDIGVKAGVVEMATGDGENPRDGDEDGDGDDDDGDNDATNARQRSKRDQAVSYGPNDDDDDAIKNAMDKETSDEESDDEAPVTNGTVSHTEDSDNEDDEMDTSRDSSPESSSSPRAERVKDAYAEVTDFDCDEKSGEWCNATFEFDTAMPKLLMINIVKSAVSKTMVREIRGVGECTFADGAIMTDGVNIPAMQQLGDFLDLDKLQTNDIAAVLDVYGVEACRNNIIKELNGVFKSHGIAVDMRHLSLIADQMTRNGGFTAFSRMGLRGNVSPFTKMSFETTVSFLKDAVLDGDWDDLTTPSSRLVMGQLGKLGTGSFDVFTQLPTHHVAAVA